MKTAIYIGAVDVDETNFNVALINSKTEDLIHFRCSSSVGSMIKKFQQRNIPLKNIRLCYEATYLGFSLYRELMSKGIQAEVIAPSLIPKKPGKKIKTDRLDCMSLADYYLKKLLTPVNIPNEEDEMTRDLINSRKLLVSQAKSIKTHILSLCKRMGFDYRKDMEKPKASYWTTTHVLWLEKKVNQLPADSKLRFNLSTLLSSFNNKETFIDVYGVSSIVMRSFSTSLISFRLSNLRISTN